MHPMSLVARLTGSGLNDGFGRTSPVSLLTRVTTLDRGGVCPATTLLYGVLWSWYCMYGIVHSYRTANRTKTGRGLTHSTPALPQAPSFAYSSIANCSAPSAPLIRCFSCLPKCIAAPGTACSFMPLVFLCECPSTFPLGPVAVVSSVWRQGMGGLT